MGIRTDIAVARKARRRGRVLLDGEASRASVIFVRLTTRRPNARRFFTRRLLTRKSLLVMSAAFVALLATAWFVPGGLADRYMPIPGIVPGTFVSEDGTIVDIPAGEPLSESVLAEVKARAEGVAVETGPSGINKYLGDTFSLTVTPYIYITPQQISCDGVEFFDGFLVAGDVVPSEGLVAGDVVPGEGKEDLAQCEMLRTLDGARALVDQLIADYPFPNETVARLEINVDKPIERADSALPIDESKVVYQTATPEPLVLTEDQKQMDGGSA